MRFWWLFFLVYLSVLLVNDGFMALDEYWVGMTRYIPAQSSTLMTLVGPDDVKSPLQLLPMHVVAQGALAAGVTAPYWQYRTVIFVLGLLSAVLLFLAFNRYIKDQALDRKPAGLLILMLTFYFAGPFVFTRPMFESLAAPWLALTGVWTLAYDEKERLSDLLTAVFFVSVAFVLRQQLGFCALALLILPALKKQWRHLLAAGGLGLFFVVISGIPDYYLRGKFHFSLLNLTLYNYEHGSEYGKRSILFYPALIFVMGLLPFFFSWYPKGFLTAQIRKNRSLLLLLGLFVFLHSLFPNKWERFIISVLPLMLLLLFPLLWELQKKFREHRLRLGLLYGVNGFLFVVASFFPAQKNLIEMSRYLDAHPEIKKIYRVADTPGWITEAFILNKQFTFVESNPEEIKKTDWSDCSRALVIGEGQSAEFREITAGLKENAQFDVNLIEQWSYRMNSRNNLRRVQLKLYSGCIR